MVICTITCHNVYNYGASLQAYALQFFLGKLEHNVRIIDYFPKGETPRFQFSVMMPNSKWEYFSKYVPFLRPLFCVLSHRKEIMFLGRKKSFDIFTKQHLRLTRKYNSYGDLCNDVPYADLYIAGSDQIWNTFSARGRDGAFYLDFVKDNIKKISYAASFGTSNIATGYEDFLRNNLSRFNRISVREHTGVDIVRSLGFDAQCVVDPVLLVSKSEWEKIALCPSNEGYILLNDFLKSDDIITNFVKKISKLTGKKVVCVNDYQESKVFEININNAGPCEFLGLIKNADIVVSNSFHTTVFSVIFQKEFFVFPLKGQKNSSRMLDFLRDLKLDKRFLPNSVRCDAIDWKQTENILNKKILLSQIWLKQSLVEK